MKAVKVSGNTVSNISAFPSISRFVYVAIRDTFCKTTLSTRGKREEGEIVCQLFHILYIVT